jgi:hypothetical protein
MMRTPLLAPLLAQSVTLRPWSRTSSRAGSRHGSPRSGHRAFRVVHDHEYWNKPRAGILLPNMSVPQPA